MFFSLLQFAYVRYQFETKVIERNLLTDSEMIEIVLSYALVENNNNDFPAGIYMLDQ